MYLLECKMQWEKSPGMSRILHVYQKFVRRWREARWAAVRSAASRCRDTHRHREEREKREERREERERQTHTDTMLLHV